MNKKTIKRTLPLLTAVFLAGAFTLAVGACRHNPKPPVSYTVTFDKNTSDPGSTEANPQAIKVTRPATTVVDLPIPPQRTDGWGFTGWNTKQDGTGDEFTATTAVTASITVYAMWLADAYTVWFDKNYSDGEGDETVLYTLTVTRPEMTINDTANDFPENPQRTGYTFHGWYPERDGTGDEFTADTAVNLSLTVYAKWTINSYTVIFDKNHDDESGWTEAGFMEKNITFPVVTIDPLPEPPTRLGYYFIGWHTPEGDVFDETTEVDRNMTVTAHWFPIPPVIPLTLYKNGDEVSGVTTIAELISWLLISGNIASNTHYRAVLRADAVMPIALALANNGTDNITLTLEGDGSRRTIKMGAKGMLEIRSGVTLILEDGITLRGRNAAEDGEDNNTPLLYVNGGALEMRPGSEISGNVNRKSSGFAYGGAVFISGIFTMKGGVIKDNTAITDQAGRTAFGSGVFVNSGTFTMEGDAYVDVNNDVCLWGSTAINITGSLSENPAALIRPQTYADGKAVLTGSVAANYDKFEVASNENGIWSINNEGNLVAPRYTISGTISLNGGSGSVTQATVQLKQNGINIGTAVNPAANGSYTFTGVVIGNNYTVTASLPNYTTETTAVFSVVNGNVSGQNLQLNATFTVNGTVALSGGSGSLTAVSVQLRQNGNTIQTVNPNGSGAYSFSGVGQGNYYSVQATLSGYMVEQSSTFNVTANYTVPALTLQLGQIWVDRPGGVTDMYANVVTALSSITTAGNYTVRVAGTHTLATNSFSFSGAGKNITLRGQDGLGKITSSGYGLFFLHEGVTLILDSNIVLEKEGGSADIIFLYPSSSLVINNQAEINKTGGGWGSAISMESGTTFTMNGGRIYTNSTDPAVSASAGIFTMNGGNISGGSNSYTGIRVGDNATFNMLNGTISGFGRGGVSVSGTFNMYGGTISGNSNYRGGGVYAVGDNVIFNKTGGTIYGNDGTANANVCRIDYTTGALMTNAGHAVIALATVNGTGNFSNAKRKETTAGPTVNLYFNANNNSGSPIFSGAWDN